MRRSTTRLWRLSCGVSSSGRTGLRCLRNLGCTSKQRHAGRERPRRIGVGRQSQACTGVVHAPLTLPPAGRAPDGRHRAPSDRSVISRQVPAFQRVGCSVSTRDRPNLRGHGITDLDLQGDNLEVLTRPPFWPLARRQPGKERGERTRVARGLPAATTLSVRLGEGSAGRDGERRSGDADQVGQVQVLTRQDDALDRRQSSVELLHE